MTTLKENKLENRNSNLKATNLVDKLYALRKDFEADYSGVLRSWKYEASREFTIALNHTIFQANQIIDQNESSSITIEVLQEKFEILKKNFQDLVD